MNSIPIDGEPKIITLEQMAEKLQVSVRTINRNRKAGILPARFFFKVGRATRVSWAALLDWIRDQPIRMKGE